jgi:hypothetical protein
MPKMHHLMRARTSPLTGLEHPGRAQRVPRFPLGIFETNLRIWVLATLAGPDAKLLHVLTPQDFQKLERPMHNYPRNSPHAAARLISLMMIADGHVCRSEFEALDKLEAEARLGLPPGGLHLVLQTFCEDLLCSGLGNESAFNHRLGGDLLGSLYDDIDDPELQRRVINYALATAIADGDVSRGEQDVILSMISHWAAAAEHRQRTSQALPR